MDECNNDFNAEFDDENSSSDEESYDSSEDEVKSENGEDFEHKIGDRFTVGKYAENNVPSTSEEDKERECCPICLNRFIGQDLGTPESCEHTFCFQCIQEWSKNINTCPVDRTEFNYIHLKTALDGKYLKKVKVKVLPKADETVLQESITQCEVCQNGDREDRLLLCDGCDLAYHCECLDPPLFYIPIEEWFCPPCSGILQNRAIAGPSYPRIRRVIPRTRASETVRSRVQNLRTQHSSVPRSSSNCSRNNITKTVKRRKRRTYKRSIKKVVQLARTKKNILDAGKGKVSARGSTILVTYKRRRRKKKKCGVKKISKRSLFSSKVLPVPSVQERIAKRLGISKPLGGSLPQVKNTVNKSCTVTMDKMHSHSIFGDKNQLMDFSENFNEDIFNKPSSSSSLSDNRRLSSENSVNILDGILAGQKLLHSKSDDIIIKIDGSLMLKASNSKTKRDDYAEKQNITHSSHTPMSVALVKEGAKSTITSQKKFSTSFNNINKLPNSDSFKSKRWSNKQNTPNSSNNKTFQKSTNNLNLYHKEKCKNFSLSTSESSEMMQNKLGDSDKVASSNKNYNNSISYFNFDVSLKLEPELFNPENIFEEKIKNVDTLTAKYKEIDCKSIVNKNSDHSNIKLSKIKQEHVLLSKDVSLSASSEMIKNKISNYICSTNDVLYGENINLNLLKKNLQAFPIKQEVLSDEDSIINSIVESNSLNDHSLEIKQEPNYLNSDVADLELYGLANEFVNNNYADSENSDYDASQSIIDSSLNHSILLQDEKCSTSKEVMPLNAEDSQLLPAININSELKNSKLRTDKSMSHELLENKLSEQYIDCKKIFPAVNKINFKPPQNNLLNSDSFEISDNESLPTTFNKTEMHSAEISDDEIPPTQIDLSTVHTLPISNSLDINSKCLDDEPSPTQLTPVLHKPLLLPSIGTSSLNYKIKHCLTAKDTGPENASFPMEKIQVLDAFADENSSTTVPSTQVLDTLADEFPCMSPAIQTLDAFVDELPSTLPATQILDSSTDESSELLTSQVLDSCVNEHPFTLSAVQLIDPSLKERSLLSNQIVPSTIKDPFNLCGTQLNGTLPGTKIHNTTSNENVEYENINNSHSLNKNNDIILNIQQIVKSLTKNLNENNIPNNHASNNVFSDDKFETSEIDSTDVSVEIDNIAKMNCNSKSIQSLYNNEINKLTSLKTTSPLRKTNRNNCNKNIGVHRHLPQVITVKPTKQPLKPKPSNQKTFSFEEVSKLQIPKTLENTSVSTVLKACTIFEHTKDKNSFPYTQEIDFIVGKADGKIKLSEENSCRNILQHEPFGKMPEDDSLPATQIADCTNKNFPEYQSNLIHSNSKIDCQNKCHNINTKYPSFKISKIKEVKGDDSDLPATQICSLTENFIKPIMPEVKYFKKDVLKPCHKAKIESNIEEDNDDDLPATQINFIEKKNFSIMSDCVVGNFSIQKQEVPLIVNSLDHPVTQILDPTSNKILNRTNEHSYNFVDNMLKNDISENKLQQNHLLYVKNDKMQLKSKGCSKSSKDNEIFLNSTISNLKEKISHLGDQVHDAYSKQEKGFLEHKFERKGLQLEQNITDVLSESSLHSYADRKVYKYNDKTLKAKFSYSNDRENSSCASIEEESKTISNVKQKESIVKNEDDDLENVLSISNNLNSVSKIKIKSEISDDDSLPPTQINFESCKNNYTSSVQVFNLNQTTENAVISNLDDEIPCSKQAETMLSHNKILKDISDDEVSIIEVKNCSNMSVKEVIFIDDDGDLDYTVQNKRLSVNCVPSDKIGNSKMVINEGNFIEEIYKNNLSPQLDDLKIASEVENNVGLLNSNFSKEEDFNYNMEVLISGNEDTVCRNIFNFENHIKDCVSLKDKQQNINIDRAENNKYVHKKKSSKIYPENIKNCMSLSDHACLKETKPFKLNSNDKNNIRNNKKYFLNKENKSKHSETSEVRSKHSDSLHYFTDVKKQDSDLSTSETKQIHCKVKLTDVKKDISRQSRQNKMAKSRCSEINSINITKHENSLDDFFVKENKSNYSSVLKTSSSKLKNSKRYSINVKNHKIPTDKDLSEHCTIEQDNKSTKYINYQKDYTNIKKFKSSTDTNEEVKQLYNKSMPDYPSKYDTLKINLKGKEKIDPNIEDDSSSKKSKHKIDNLKYISHEKIKDTEKSHVSKQIFSLKKYKYEEHQNSCKTFNCKGKDHKCLNLAQTCETISNSPSWKKDISKSTSVKGDDNKEVIITLKSRKRSKSPIINNRKKLRYDESSNSETFIENVVNKLNSVESNSLIFTNQNPTVIETNCDTDDSINSFEKFSRSPVHRDAIKVNRKQELKEEIANEVKLILKPFFSTGLITKDNYKDIMRRTVPKIFMNCHNCINPEKIRKLVLSYISFLHKS